MSTTCSCARHSGPCKGVKDVNIGLVRNVGEGGVGLEGSDFVMIAVAKKLVRQWCGNGSGSGSDSDSSSSGGAVMVKS